MQEGEAGCVCVKIVGWSGRERERERERKLILRSMKQKTASTERANEPLFARDTE